MKDEVRIVEGYSNNVLYKHTFVVEKRVIHIFFSLLDKEKLSSIHLLLLY